MIKFSEYIAELFTGQNGYEWHTRNEYTDFFAYRFSDGNRNYDLSYSSYKNKKYVLYEITLSVNKNGLTSLRLTRDNDLKSALKVYNTVADILRKKLLPKLKSGDQVLLEAVQSHMSKLYSRFADLIAKEANGRVVERNYVFTVEIK